MINPEAAKHQPFVLPQVHTFWTIVGSTEETELIDTRDSACKHAGLSAIMVLFVVDDLMEMKDSFQGWVVLPQEDRESRLWL